MTAKKHKQKMSLENDKNREDDTNEKPDLGSTLRSETSTSTPTPTKPFSRSPISPILPSSSPAPLSDPVHPSKKWQRIRQTRFYRFLSWTPPRCRFDPERPPQFSMALNVLFGFAGCFTVANLYYSHPILNLLARDFGVDEESVSQVRFYYVPR